jgi:hypothetical protein
MSKLKRTLKKAMGFVGIGKNEDNSGTCKPKRHDIELKDDDELPLEEVERLKVQSKLEEEADKEDEPLHEGALAERRGDKLFRQGKYDLANQEYEHAFDFYFERDEAEAARIATLHWDLAGIKKDARKINSWGSRIMRLKHRYQGLDSAIEFAADKAIGDYAMEMLKAVRSITDPETTSKERLALVRYISSYNANIRFYCGQVRDLVNPKKK